MFEKFLKGLQTPKIEEAKERLAGKRIGRPRKADSDLKYPRKDKSRYGKNGVIKPSCRKYTYKKGSHYKKLRSKWKRTKRNQRRKAEVRAKEKAYKASQRKKYLQNRLVAVTKAKKLNLDPLSYYQLSYEDWLLLWATTPDVTHPIRGRITAAQACNNPIKDPDATYVARLDSSKSYTRDNVAVFQYRKALPNKLNGHS